MIRRGMQPCSLQRGHHRPIGIGREIGRGRLDDDFACGARRRATRRYIGNGIQFAEREVGRGRGRSNDDDVGNGPSFSSSHFAASSLMTLVFGCDSEPWFKLLSLAEVRKVLVISGSKSTSVSCFTCGYFNTSRAASPSPPPKINTFSAFCTICMAGSTRASW